MCVIFGLFPSVCSCSFPAPTLTWTPHTCAARALCYQTGCRGELRTCTAADTALHTRSFVMLTLLLRDLGLLRLTLAAAPALVQLPLGEHFPRCKRQEQKINRNKKSERLPSWKCAMIKQKTWRWETSRVSCCKCRAEEPDAHSANENTKSIQNDIMQPSSFTVLV